jgi:hypothetical protein
LSLSLSSTTQPWNLLGALLEGMAGANAVRIVPFSQSKY